MNLTNEMAKYRIAQVRYQEAIDTQEHYWKWTPHNYKNESLEYECTTKLELSKVEMNNSSSRITELEKAIKLKDPKFSLNSLRLKNW
jgi:hypothetical protein